jgi:hypothetical protein
VTNLWAVYDRSKDNGYNNNYAFDTTINIEVNAKDRLSDPIDPAPGFNFRIEIEAEYEETMANLPDTVESTESGSTTITFISDNDLNGFQIVYDENESIEPYIDSSDEIPPLSSNGITGIGLAANLQPPTVFDHPITIILPCPGEYDLRDLMLYLYNGNGWVYACSSYNTGGVVQPGGEGWIVPGSLKYHVPSGASSQNDKASPNEMIQPSLEIQVYHFSAIQAGFVASGNNGGGSPVVSSGGGGGGGGCFISALQE